MRIAFVISSLAAGGAERVATILCREWAAAGHGVDLLTYHAPDDALHFAPPAGTTHIPLDLCRKSGSLWRSLANTLGRVRAIRRVLREITPDVVVSFMPETNLVAILAGVGASWPTVAAERIHPQHHPVSAPVRGARKLLYRRAACIVAQTDEIGGYCRRHFGANVAIIPNPLELDRFTGMPRVLPADCGGMLLSVGRLSRQKGHDLTIRAFAALAAEFPNWNLVIAGEGELRGELHALAQELGIGGRVSMLGVVTDIESLFAKASVFVHASRYEGFPNALSEALASGLPVVATDCPGGPGSLISHGRSGLLVPADDVVSLGEAMRQVMSEPSLRWRLSRGALEAVRHLDAPRISARWLQLLGEFVADCAECDLGAADDETGAPNALPFQHGRNKRS